jgi:DNA-binding transcriptional ArsR family regulator
MADDEPRLIKDAAVLRALAHPARMAILNHLGQGGSVTATECAELVGLSPSATSYHLRALAKAGLVEEAPGRGDGRERVWRGAGGHGYAVRLEQDADPEAKQAERDVIEAFLTWEETRSRQYLARADQEPHDWFESSFFNEADLTMTAEELRKLGDDLQELIKPFRRRLRTDPPPEARNVAVQFRGFPSGPAL